MLWQPIKGARQKGISLPKIATATSRKDLVQRDSGSNELHSTEIHGEGGAKKTESGGNRMRNEGHKAKSGEREENLYKMTDKRLRLLAKGRRMRGKKGWTLFCERKNEMGKGKGKGRVQEGRMTTDMRTAAAKKERCCLSSNYRSLFFCYVKNIILKIFLFSF
ncbi:hypothetical protein J1N35_020025 [Gossypium stocksii]|uniref:Uncharacterized protein n=1 Tax=Gossypium stocksii TaxID=47602 RepID=A0A9D3VD45_9ROSI|nr:hypothetical protein J1N35_020025 [Gossypium stocksii]